MKKKIYLSLISIGLIILFLISFVNANYNAKNKSKIYLRIVYVLPDNLKNFIKENIFVFDRIRSLENQIKLNKKKINSLVTNFEDLQRDGKIEKIYFEKNSDEKIFIDNKKFLLKKFKTNFLNSSKNINAKGTSYIEFYNNYLFLVSATGITSFIDGNSFEEKNEFNFYTIKNNIKDIIKYEDFFIDSKYGIKDIKIIEDKLYISYTNQLKKNCFNISILVAEINYEELFFEKFFVPNECVLRDKNFTKFNPHHSGGRIEELNQNLILLSIGDFKNMSLPQSNDSIFGKIVSINKKNKQYKIISKGLRNAQGLYVDTLNSLIISSDHGPEGGDEINLQKINNTKVSNFGWPISSYGEHYGFKSKDEKNKLYKIAPLHKSHQDFGFIEPIKYFSPGIGISQVENFFDDSDNKKYLVGSMGHDAKQGRRSIHLIVLDDLNQIIKSENITIGERVRDIISTENKLEYFLLLENGPILGYLKGLN